MRELNTNKSSVFSGMIIIFIIVSLFSNMLAAQSLRPKDIIFELLHKVILRPLPNAEYSKAYDEMRETLGARILQNAMSPDQVDEVLTKFKGYERLLNIPENWLQESRDKMIRGPLDLTKLNSREKLITLWEDPNGRLFDSSFANYLVKNPPPEILKAMSLLGRNFNALLKNAINAQNMMGKSQGEMFNKKLAQLVFTIIKSQDPRFWFRKVPEIWEIYNFDLDGITNAKLKTEWLIHYFEFFLSYLGKEKTTGWEAISVPYFVNKIALNMREDPLKAAPLFLTEADSIYQKYFEPLSRGIKNYEISQLEREIPLINYDGISLPGQIGMPRDYTFITSSRAAVTNGPAILFNPRATLFDPRPVDIPSDFAKHALVNQLIHGATWGSGISGSTNISLSATRWFNEHMNAQIDEKAAFAGILMFLVYDGGHSIADVLWAADIVDKAFRQLGKPALNFGLSDILNLQKAHDFIPDFSRFLDIYSPGTNLRTSLEAAFSSAFGAVFKKFEKR